MKLSVCLIVKNEEEVIERCLKCVSKFADEIVVVDTGSTDKTKELLKKYTPNIYDFVWCDDFSKARNYSFCLAKYDYIMWIDADDIIDDENISKIIKLKENLNADTYMLKYQTAFDKSNKPTFEFYRERIVKNNKNALWHGFIHEAITPFGKIEYLDIAIQHRKEKKTDPKRNLKIYNKHLKTRIKLLPREQYYYSKELYYNHYYKKCITELKKYLKQKPSFMPNTIDAILTLARCYNYIYDTTHSLETLLKGLKYVTPTSEYMCEIGNIFYNRNEYEKAIPFYYSSLSIYEKNNGSFYNKEYYHFIPHIQLSVCYYNLGNYTTAKHYHELAKQENPNNDIILNNEKYFLN